MPFSKVHSNCIGCEKPIYFSSCADFKDCKLEEQKPWIISATLHTTIVICGGCKVANRYIAEEGGDRIEEAIYDL